MAVRIVLAFAFSLISCAAFSQTTEPIDDRAAVRKLAEQFEQARVTLDLQALQALVHPEATHLSIRGRDSRPMWKDLRSAKSSRKPTQAKVEPVSVVSREVSLRKDTAIVEELLSVDVGATITDKTVAPRRRSVVWSRDAHGWRVVHLHSSPYSTWEKAIGDYERADAKQPPEKGGVVFIGSSSIRGWKTLDQDFPDHHVIGRGFGGSQMVDSLIYARRVVLPYAPRGVVVYAGDNDIAAGKTPERVLADFRAFVDVIHAGGARTRVAFIAIKPSLRRWQLWSVMERANGLVEAFAEDQAGVDYLDIATPMLGDDGTPDKNLFVDDGLHLNREGYVLWTSVVMPWVQNL